MSCSSRLLVNSGNSCFSLSCTRAARKAAPSQQAADHRVHPLADQPAQPFGNAGILFGEFLRVLREEAEFLIVEVEELLVHRPYLLLIAILPVSSSRSATNWTGTLSGSQLRSARTRKRTFNSAASRESSRSTAIDSRINRGS